MTYFIDTHDKTTHTFREHVAVWSDESHGNLNDMDWLHLRKIGWVEIDNIIYSAQPTIYFE